MKFKNILTIFFLFLLGITGINAYNLDENVKLWYKLQNNATDFSFNGYNGTNNGATFNGTRADFDGTNDDILINYPFAISGDFTFNYNVNYDVFNDGVIFTTDGDRGGGSNFFHVYATTTNNRLRFIVNGASSVNIYTNTTGLTTGTWYNVVFTRNSSSCKIYLNGVLDAEETSCPTEALTNSDNFRIGSYSTSNFLNGQLKDISFFNYSLTQSEVTELYNNGITEQTGATTTFNSPQQGDYLNSTTIPINVSFSQITNSSYKLNNGLKLSLGTNTNESTTTLTGVEGVNNLTIFTNTNGELTNSSINFTVDTTLPTINNSLPSILREFNINLSNYISATDTNLDYWEVIENGSQIVNSTNTSYTFPLIKQYNLTINAYDLAGNINTSNHLLTISPFLEITAYGNTTGTPYQLSSVSWTIGGETQSSNPFKADLINYLSNNVSNVSINIIATDNSYLHRNYNQSYVLNRTNYNTNITLLPNQLVLMFEQNGVSTSSDGFIYDENLFTAEFNGTNFIIVQDSLSTGDVKVEFNTLNGDYSQYFEYYNDKVENHLTETLELLQSGDTYGYFKTIDNSENPIDDVTVIAYTNYHTLNQSTYAKKIGQRITNDDGRTFFNFDSGYITKFRFIKEGYVPKDIIYSLNDWSDVNQTEYSLDNPLLITLTEESNLVKDNVYVSISKYFTNETGSITGTITGLNKETATITTSYRTSLGYNDYEYSFNSEDQVTFTLYDTLDFDKSSTANIEITITIDGEEWGTVTLTNYTPAEVFDLSDIDPIILGFGIFILSIIMGLVFKNIEAGTNTFFGASLVAVLFNEAFIGIAVISVLYYSSNWIKTIIQESSSDIKKFFLFVTFLNIILNLTSALAVNPTSINYNMLLGTIGWLMENMGKIGGLTTIGLGITAIVGTIKRFTGQEMTLGDAIIWGSIILLALTVNPISLTSASVETELEQLLIWMLTFVRTLLMGIMVISGYILIKNKGN